MKTKVLISCTVNVQLICAFVFAYAKSRFSHEAAQIILTGNLDPKSDMICPHVIKIYPLDKILQNVDTRLGLDILCADCGCGTRIDYLNDF